MSQPPKTPQNATFTLGHKGIGATFQDCGKDSRGGRGVSAVTTHTRNTPIIFHSPRQHMGTNEDLGHFSVALPALATSFQSLDASWPHAGVSHSGCNHIDERYERDLCRLMLPKHHATSLDPVAEKHQNTSLPAIITVCALYCSPLWLLPFTLISCEPRLWPGP